MLRTSSRTSIISNTLLHGLTTKLWLGPVRPSPSHVALAFVRFLSIDDHDTRNARGGRIYRPAVDSPQVVPDWRMDDLNDILNHRAKLRKEKDYATADSFLQQVRDWYGIRRVDDKRGVYRTFENFYRSEDYMEFKRDEKDSHEIPYYWESGVSEIESNLNDIREKSLKYNIWANNRSLSKRFVSPPLESSIRELENIFGVEVDLTNRTWKLKEKFKLLPLHHKKLRHELATLIKNYLDDNNFKRISAGSCVYARPLELENIEAGGEAELRIRSSIEEVDDESIVGEGGDQAIQIYVAYIRKSDNWGYERVIYRTPKIMRVGELANIVKRLGKRVEDAETKAQDEIKLCQQCTKAPLFLSAKGNWVCSHFCWTKTVDDLHLFQQEEAAAMT